MPHIYWNVLQNDKPYATINNTTNNYVTNIYLKKWKYQKRLHAFFEYYTPIATSFLDSCFPMTCLLCQFLQFV